MKLTKLVRNVLIGGLLVFISMEATRCDQGDSWFEDDASVQQQEQVTQDRSQEGSYQVAGWYSNRGSQPPVYTGGCRNRFCGNSGTNRTYRRGGR